MANSQGKDGTGTGIGHYKSGPVPPMSQGTLFSLDFSLHIVHTFPSFSLVILIIVFFLLSLSPPDIIIHRLIAYIVEK